MTAGLLDANGYEVRTVDGVDIVCKKGEPKPEADADPLVYRPRFRDAGYLVDLVAPLVKGTFANKRVLSGALSVGKPDEKAPGASAPTATLRPGNGDDFVLFVGSERERSRLQVLLAQLDVPGATPPPRPVRPGPAERPPGAYAASEAAEEAVPWQAVVDKVCRDLRGQVGCVQRGEREGGGVGGAGGEAVWKEENGWVGW